MRVVVATDRHPALSSAQAGAAIGTAWAELHAQVAVVPLGNALEGFQQALADLFAGSLDVFADGTSLCEAETEAGLIVALRPEHVPAEPGIDGASSSLALGRLVRDALEQARTRGAVAEVVLELGDRPCHDGGAGLLSAWGATGDRPLDGGVDALAGITRCDLATVREWLGDTRLTLVVPAGEQSRHLIGLKGITSVRGHQVGIDPARLLATDQALVDFADACGSGSVAASPGAGAAGGIGHAVMALGGRVLTGAGYGREASKLDQTIGRADLVITGGGQLDFGTMGGDVLFTVVDAATQALRPVIVIAEQNFISPRELRSIGVEAAYSVRDPQATGGPVEAEELTNSVRPVAASWAW